MKIATWNVNGIRARQGQLLEWLAAEQPDVVCLQEIKASIDQLPFELADVEGYWSYWHGGKGYSGVGLLLSKSLVSALPACTHPAFDFEQRIVCATLPSPAAGGGNPIGGGNPLGLPITIASVYVPNGGKDFEAKLGFLDALDRFAADATGAGRALILCGDLNVAREERDVHVKLRKANQIGTRPDERALLERLISRGLVDVGRTLDPDNDTLFTWWAPWRQMKERNIGWRIDYVLASTPLGALAKTSVVQREVGSSDHGPVVVGFDISR